MFIISISNSMRKTAFLELWITAFIFQSAIYMISSLSSHEGMFNNVLNSGVKRHKRSEDVIDYGLTSQEIAEAVQVHNDLRRLINASNMEYMIWNDALASMAAEWASGCKWGHGQPPMHEDVEFIQLGQNLYYNTGVRNVSHAINRWYYAEVDFYDHVTGHCSGMCGHYTQLIWAPSREMGCAYNFCETMTDMASGKVIQNSWYFACNYGPAGNVKGKEPYNKGPSCSDCPSGQYWCDRTSPRGLCRRDCDGLKSNCECEADCANGGAPDCDCKCSCADGWTDVRCTQECKDYNPYCGRSPGYPEFSCWDPTHGDNIKKLCPKLCGQCNKLKENSPATVKPCKFAESTTQPATEFTTVISNTTYSSLVPSTTINHDWSTDWVSVDLITDSSMTDSSDIISTSIDQASPRPTNGFVDGSYVAWIFLETLRPEDIQQAKEELQKKIAERANEYCQVEKCCPADKDWISGMSITKEDVTITVHSWVNDVTKVSVHIRLDLVCSTDSFFRSRVTEDFQQVFLPKDLLMTILKDELANLNSTLHVCCTVSIISVQETENVPVDEEQPGNAGSGKLSRTWIVAVIVIVVNAVLILIALSIAFAIKRRMSENEKRAIVTSMAPVRQLHQSHPQNDQSFGSSALSTTYEIPYSHYDIPKSHCSASDPYSSLDNTADEVNKKRIENSGNNQLHFLYDFGSSQTSI